MPSSRIVWSLLLTGAIAAASLSAWAQTANPASQIDPGTTGSISPAQGVASKAADAPSNKINSALSPTTRQTLFEAMNSVDLDSIAVQQASITLGPGEGAELDGTAANRMTLPQLPAPLQSALQPEVEQALSPGAGR